MCYCCTVPYRFYLIIHSELLIMPSTCFICKRAKKKGDNVSMHGFSPKSEPIKRQNWLRALNLNDHEIMDHHRICSRHFQHGDVTQIPSLQLGA